MGQKHSLADNVEYINKTVFKTWIQCVWNPKNHNLQVKLQKSMIHIFGRYI